MCQLGYVHTAEPLFFICVLSNWLKYIIVDIDLFPGFVNLDTYTRRSLPHVFSCVVVRHTEKFANGPQ